MILKNFFSGVGADVMTFGEELRIRRKQKGFTQDGLAKAAHGVCTGAYISELERGSYIGKRGRPTRPDQEIVDALARVLDWPLSDARTTAGYAPPDMPNRELTVDMLLHSGYENLTPEQLAAHVAQIKRISEALLARDD